MTLSDENRELAVRYVVATGFYKNRVANYLGISRPTLDKVFKEDLSFFTQLKAADAVFCKNLIINTANKNPAFLLKTKYREEFDDSARISVDPEEEIKKLISIIDSATS